MSPVRQDHSALAGPNAMRTVKTTSNRFMNSKDSRRESVSPAERMSLHRRRRRNGLRCIRILLHETEIDSLIAKGFLKPERRHDQDAVEAAIGAFVCYALGPAA
jgi:hypothetical protein